METDAVEWKYLLVLFSLLSILLDAEAHEIVLSGKFEHHMCDYFGITIN